MTLVVSTLCAEYALVCADNKQSIIGPGSIAANLVLLPSGQFQRDGDRFVCFEGETFSFYSRDQQLWKVKFTEDYSEAFSFSGSRDAADRYLGLTGVERSLAADESLWRYFSARSNIKTGPTVPPGEYPTIAGLHVYELPERFVATTFDASVCRLSRECKRSSKQETRYVAIGSGTAELNELLAVGDLATEWVSITENPHPAVETVLDFWSKIFYVVSKRVGDVGPEMWAWVKRRGQLFVAVGARTRDADYLQRVEEYMAETAHGSYPDKRKGG